MFFLNDEHENNYFLLMDKYNLERGQNIQYEAAIYIASCPGIFDHINLDKLRTNVAPLYSLAEWVGDDATGKYVISAAGLTGSTTRLAEVGLSLYNGYKVGLDDVFGSVASQELFDVFVQACKIRARK